MDKNLENINESQYTVMVEQKAKKSSLGKNCFFAFIFGGAFCIVAQLFHDLIMWDKLGKWLGTVTEEDAAALTALFMVFLGSLLTILNLYDNIGKVAGAGSIVPISGFANSIVSPAMEFRSEGRILGSGAQMFIVAGPVIVYGCTAAVVVGTIYYLFTH